MAKKPEKEAPAPEGEEGAEGEAPAKKKPPILIIAIAAGVLVLGGGGAAAFFLLKPKPAAEAGEHGEKKEEKKKEKKKEEKGDKKDAEKGAEGAAGTPVIKEGPDGVVFYTLPDIVVNMQTADGKSTFLKLKLTFELPDEETADELTPNLPRLQDMFQTFLRELRPEDLNGSQGTYQLRVELLRRVNLVAAPAKVNAVLIEEMLIN
ncbi:flagellar FliL protein [Caulobacter vibrioides]|uniref:Flagellar FliL protein n=2 Tax=Caulobacter vibrioides TaxID=155892 RepID=FLIL_CAUVC|nr:MULTISPECIES: flagellar basal body-associated protein FliL [Caulobacter]YP_002517514.1 flagellar fliL protein [Caulobacter vibrioides NA1000]B8GXB6.1 RecName: Full=Flagellar FliL protein [Caulobacter vibrioides NA1000]P0CG27.1 PUTATIVE PSEUDOGENE: RecName: Full=Flagellar FliL protein [Caulobacter vibrioides CB15]ACL95606.1 flagellar fliL protein [Caulobacter vibrioides NA1000]ATC25018.1 flagellar FliL protein [Caulobacter vibrioides]ATC28931.1 flagellar FliL protein [Caulobacter vibrioides